jgi:hypothetical protein
LTKELYHLSPVILSDDLFFKYRPALTITGTSDLRQAAYLTAEQQMMTALNTPLIPTSITGTFFAPPGNNIVLDWDRVQSIDNVTVLTDDGGCNCNLGNASACAFIRSGVGYVDVRRTAGLVAAQCSCGGGSNFAYQFRIAYTAGLPTGTAANDANLHIALAMAAELDLKEMIDPGALEGGAGDPGVTQFGSKNYSETRVDLKNTPFGTSAVANHIFNRIRHLRRYRALRF